MSELRITEYYAENFKRLRFVQFRPTGRITAFTGKNDQGKTSALDVVPYVLGGKRWAPEMPKRKGASAMKVRLNMGSFTVTRTESGMSLEMAPGEKAWDTPQAMLNSIFDELAFDPMEFVRMKPEQQVDLLKKSLKLSEDLDKLTRENAEDYNARTEINREIKRLEGEIAGITVQDGLPKQKVDEAAIEAEISKAADHNRNMAEIIQQRSKLEAAHAYAQTNDKRNADFIAEATLLLEGISEARISLDHRIKTTGTLLDAINALTTKLNDPDFVSAPATLQFHIRTAHSEASQYLQSLKDMAAQKQTEHETKTQALAAAKAQVKELKAAVEAAGNHLLVAPTAEAIDMQPLMTKMREAQTANREIDKRSRRDDLQKTLNEKRNEAARLTRAMDARDERKADAITNAKLPVEGLTFTEGEVLFNGVPIQQLGEAKQIKISIALILARNPKLRLVVIKHGEALDEDSIAELQKMADEHDFYVWMAKVDSSGKVGIYLEDGEVKAINEI